MKKLEGKLTFSNVIACIALFVALGGAAVAATSLPKNSVGTRQLKKAAVTSAKVKDGSLKGVDFAPGQLPAGKAGERGLPGSPGERGPSDAYYVLDNNAGSNSKTISVSVPAGDYAVSASVMVANSDMANWARVNCVLESPQDETLGHYGVANLFAGLAQGPADAFYGMNATEAGLSLPVDGTIKYECTRPSGTASVSIYQARIVAIRVGTLH
ncbi:MAG TPA: hypothetical protein VFI17_03400 [Solirubrobacterales bacterium]|nr:hypothetical protein [Solirubrobacterales bacterium]